MSGRLRVTGDCQLLLRALLSNEEAVADPLDSLEEHERRHVLVRLTTNATASSAAGTVQGHVLAYDGRV
jgi:hypothetical protein